MKSVILLLAIAIIAAVLCWSSWLGRINSRAEKGASTSNVEKRVRGGEPLKSSPRKSNCRSISTLHSQNDFYINEYNRKQEAKREGFETRGVPFSKAMSNGKVAWENSANSTDYPRLMEFVGGANLIFHPAMESEKNTFRKSMQSIWYDTDTGILSGRMYIPPSAEVASRTPARVLRGETVTFTGWYVGNFGHFLHDTAPVLAWLRENLSADIRFLLVHDPKHEEILRTIDQKFVDERVTWIKRDELVRIEGKVSVFQTREAAFRTYRPVEALGRWLKEAHSHESSTDGEQVIIYYSRGGSKGTHHGRVVEPSHERDILAAIRAKMRKHNRKENLVVFTGQEDGATMAVQRQFELFRSASTVIGPHGSGLANVLWLDSSSAPSCGRSNGNLLYHRPQVLEFLLGPDSVQVQSGAGPYEKTYYQLYATIPWVKYHHILYAKNSTQAKTYVSIDDLNAALDAMWDFPKQPKAIRNATKLNFLHVGKAGGGTVQEHLATAHIRYRHCHPGPCSAVSTQPNLITLRDPVDRFISDFYWQAHLVDIAPTLCSEKGDPSKGPSGNSRLRWRNRLERFCHKADGSDGVRPMLQKYDHNASSLGEALCSSPYAEDVQYLEHAGNSLTDWLNETDMKDWERLRDEAYLAAVVLEGKYDFVRQIDAALTWLLGSNANGDEMKDQFLNPTLQRWPSGHKRHSSISNGTDHGLTDLATCCVVRYYRQDYAALASYLPNLFCHGEKENICKAAIKSMVERRHWALEDEKKSCEDLVNR